MTDVTRQDVAPQTVEVLSRWMFDWACTIPNCTCGAMCTCELMTMRDLAEALLDPTQHGPLANPEFVSRLPGSRMLHVHAETVTIDRTR